MTTRPSRSRTKRTPAKPSIRTHSQKALAKAIEDFRSKIWTYYRTHGRSLEWRRNITEYRVVVSEIMLQQTQVERVSRKFPTFIARFPDWQSLASASQEDILREWQGMGYSRRALALRRIASTVVARGGTLPRTPEELEELPSIGPNTAGSITAFAFNTPTIFIETNIRSVFIHEFFPRARTPIHDDKIIPLVGAALDTANPREWYYALMDYGSMLKRSGTVKNPSRRSVHHTTQSSFNGSRRQIRSFIIKSILAEKQLTLEALTVTIRNNFPDHTHTSEQTIARIIEELLAEGFISQKSSTSSAPTSKSSATSTPTHTAQYFTIA